VEIVQLSQLFAMQQVYWNNCRILRLQVWGGLHSECCGSADRCPLHEHTGKPSRGQWAVSFRRGPSAYSKGFRSSRTCPYGNLKGARINKRISPYLKNGLCDSRVIDRPSQQDRGRSSWHKRFIPRPSDAARPAAKSARQAVRTEPPGGVLKPPWQRRRGI